MQSWICGIVTLAVGAGCGSSMRAPSKDAGSDVAASSGGAPGAGGAAGTGGALGSGGALGTGGSPAGGTTGGRGGSPGNGGTAAPGTGGRVGAGGYPIAGVIGTGGAGRDSGTVDANLDASPDGSTDAVGLDALCQMWQARDPTQDTLALQQYALFKVGTVLEGTLGDFVLSGNTPYALFTVDRVWAGISPYAGLASAIRMDRTLYDQMGKGAQVIAGLRQTHPLTNSDPPVPMWEAPHVLLPKSTAVAAELLGFHAWNTPNVAVFRVAEVLDGGFRLALVESLRGELPASFVVSVSELWPSLGLTTGSTGIGGFGELMQVPTGATPSATLLELRPDTPEERTAVKLALKALEPTGFATRYQAEIDQAKTDALRLRLGWLYNQANRVVALEVTGIGNECCTGAGGIFHASTVVETLAGQVPAGQLLTGGHAYYRQKACGDRFLYALGPTLALADGLGLDCQGKVSVNTQPGSQVLHEQVATAENLTLARQWVSSAPPLLQLYPAEGPLGFSPRPGLALWSTPGSALAASMAGTPAIFTITDVAVLVAPPGRIERDSYAVRMRTTFSLSESAVLQIRDVEVAFTCADPRLLVAGTRFIGAVIGTAVVSASTAATPLAEGRLFLAPGLMLPERSDVQRALGLLPAVVVN